MAENKELDSELIKTPYNPLDPVVVIDPSFNGKSILKGYEKPSSMNSEQVYSSLKDDGINIPVIRLNNITLSENQIDQLKIYYDEFLPKIHLSIKDTDNLIKVCDSPGFDNEIAVVITAQVNGFYKKISLLFYITNFEPADDYIAYDGVFKLKSLNTHIMKQIGEGKLNTYDTLLEIAKENKLGFAATKGCKDIKDERYRLIQTKTYVDYVKEIIGYGGLDEESIFDAWIDLFGYIVMVNVHFVLNEDIEPQNLTIYTMVNGNNMLNNDKMNPGGVQVQRTLTNNKINTASTNLQFENYENIIDTNNIYKKGSLNTNWYMSSPCDENNIEMEQIQIIENSADGDAFSEEYEFSKAEWLGIEFSEEPILMKKSINKKYFEKLRAKRLKVELINHNLGLERGTLVNIVFKEYNSKIIKVFKGDKEVEESPEGVINPYASGMYYIDSMEFEYVVEKHKIQQYLYLIKRDVDVNPINKLTGPIGIDSESEN